MLKSRIKTLFLAASVTLLAASLISFPQESFDASIRGLNMWWEIVFPSLLPFFIVSEMLIGFGVVRFIGVLLEPLMRPLFKVPGVGGFVWAMGMASGFPAGAKLTARLRQEGQLTKIEAERLVSFTNSSNPLFIFGAVSVGFFYNVQLGIILALAHYLGNISVGLIMRFYGRSEEKSSKEKDRNLSIRDAFAALHRTRIKDNRPIGKLLGDAVMSSIQTLLMIGGFIILFSVINKLLFHLHITAFLAEFIEIALAMLGMTEMLSMPYISGLFEITLGSQMTSQVQEATLMHQAVITSFILAFSGFSVQAQVASILAQTDIRFQPFFFARILHGIFAAVYAYLLWTPVYERFFEEGQPSNALPVMEYLTNEGSRLAEAYSLIAAAGPLVTIGSLILYIWILGNRMMQQK
ncbi:sporulation integral membrane protein YlbJ [Mesobacillus subterraneus]|uniref:Sporulation integral membrane protein YlbJ n=1 Tax=Mesobacillus subterraneus TaxID=285983 RepID=A0A3R9EDU2_9BACI|nr:sporulation integral membrane protein YlbJ [Mesobacillus subterraneus]RSD28130.1 sporulation integral membrane protein YlbJ [Mesobacillus subterraneus]